MRVRLNTVRRRKFLIGATLVVLVIGGTGIFLLMHSTASTTIPPQVVQEAPFAIYIPSRLPSDYRIASSSFKYVPTQGVLVFSATDQIGDSIAFTEQAKPKKINFANIYSTLFKNSSELPDMPYPSTVGSTIDQQTTLLSIVTPTTWLLATTQANINDHDMQTIAQSVKQY